MPPRYPKSPNTIVLNLDFYTLDALRTRARERNSEPHRCAYELLQECLGVRPALPATMAVAEPESDITFDWRRNHQLPANGG